MRKIYFLISLLLLSAMAIEARNAKIATKAVTNLATPVVKPATNITSNGFTANWEAVPGAEAYCVYVYIKNVAESDDEYAIVDEDFAGISSGSIIEPAGGDESSVDLSAYGYAFTYGWEAYAYPTFIPSMVAGLLYSPYLYLTNDSGNYKIILTTYSSNGDEIRVESHGAGDKEVVTYTVEIPNGGSDMFTKELEFSNGTRDLFFSAINVTAQVGQADYTDRIVVTQNLKAGDEVYTNIAADESVMAEDDYGFEITSKNFTLPSIYLDGHTQVYYDVYAAYNDFDTPNGSLPYTLVTSPYSKRVLVDLENRTSEVIEPETSSITDINANETQPADDAWYDLTGRRVSNPTNGLYIHNGKKVIIK